MYRVYNKENDSNLYEGNSYDTAVLHLDRAVRLSGSLDWVIQQQVNDQWICILKSRFKSQTDDSIEL